MAKTATLLPLLLLPFGAQSQDYDYEIADGKVTITGYNGLGGEIGIPETIQGLPVVSIGNRAFQDNHTLTGVTIPGSVTNISELAFYHCINLASVVIADSVVTIGYEAFSGCTGLTSISIPEGVTTIGRSAFAHTGLKSITIPDSVTSLGGTVFEYCADLESIILNAANTSYASEDGVLFDKGITTLIQFPGGKGGRYAVPEGVSSIGGLALRGSERLTRVTIPASVTSIGIGAFYGCSSLAGVYFEGNAPVVGVRQFNETDDLTVFYLPGTTGWGETFAQRPTALWLPEVKLTGLFGVVEGRFGFEVTWARNTQVIIEASEDLVNPDWAMLDTLTLTGGEAYFSDPDWASNPGRFYRLRHP